MSAYYINVNNSNTNNELKCVRVRTVHWICDFSYYEATMYKCQRTENSNLTVHRFFLLDSMHRIIEPTKPIQP